MKLNPFYSSLFLVAAVGIVGCSKKSDSSSDTTPTASISAQKPSTVAGALGTKAATAGSSLGSSLGNSSFMTMGNDTHKLDDTTYCSEHGYPVAVDANHAPITTQGACTGSNFWDTSGTTAYCRMGTSNSEYTAMSFYCFVSRNTGSPDSLQGAFTSFKNIMCALERAGITWHATDPGTDDTGTMTMDTNCFTAAQLTDMCNGASSCSSSGSYRAILNPDSYYDTGIKITAGSSIFNAKTKVSGTTYEIVVQNNGSGAANQNDVYSAKYDSSTNTFTYEGRFDRMNCTTYSSCGWGRHFRISLDLDSSANPVPESVEGVLANIYTNSTDSNSNKTIDSSEITGYSSELLTIRGNMATGNGLTGEYRSTSTNTTTSAGITYVITGSNMSSSATTYCYAKNSVAPASGACSGISAVTVPSGAMAFFLPGSPYRVTSSPTATTQYLDNSYWYSSLAGLSFTTVDLTKTEP